MISGMLFLQFPKASRFRRQKTCRKKEARFLKSSLSKLEIVFTTRGMKLMTTMMKGMAITMMLKMDVRMMASLMIMSSNSMVVRAMEDGIEDALRG